MPSQSLPLSRRLRSTRSSKRVISDMEANHGGEFPLSQKGTKNQPRESVASQDLRIALKARSASSFTTDIDSQYSIHYSNYHPAPHPAHHPTNHSESQLPSKNNSNHPSPHKRKYKVTRMANSPLKLRISCNSPSSSISSFFGLDGSNDDPSNLPKPFVRIPLGCGSLAGEDDPHPKRMKTPKSKKIQEQILQLLAASDDALDPAPVFPPRPPICSPDLGRGRQKGTGDAHAPGLCPRPRRRLHTQRR
jgi:hypothetical protein